MEKVVKNLFTTDTDVILAYDTSIKFSNCTLDELHWAYSKIKGYKASGPICIPEIIRTVAVENPDYDFRVYNKFAKHVIFPRDWQKAK